MASSSEDLHTSGAFSTDDENLDDTQEVKGKKKRFKPMKALKSLFSSKKRKRDKEGVSKAKSTSELAHSSEPTTSSSPLNGNRCLSEDSVFSPDASRDSMPQKKSVSLEVLSTNAGMKADLFARIQARSSDEGFSSPLGSQSMDELVVGGIRPGMSTESQNSLLSYGSSSDDDFFNTSWKVDTAQSVMLATPDTSTDLDLDAVSSTVSLRHDAAQHKRSVRPRTKRASSFARSKQPPVLALPSLKEESPARDITNSTPDTAAPTSPTKSMESIKEKPEAPPKTLPKPSRLSVEMKDEELPPTTEKSETPAVTLAMLGEVKLRRQSDSENVKRRSSEIEKDNEISKAFGKLKRQSQESEDKLQKSEVASDQKSELDKILQKRKSLEVEQKQTVEAKDSKSSGGSQKVVDKSKASKASENIKPVDSQVKTPEVVKDVLEIGKKEFVKAEKDKKVSPLVAPKEPKIELGSVRLRAAKKDVITKSDETESDSKDNDSSESKPMSLSERMSVFGAPLKVRKVKFPDRRSKTVEVEKLPSDLMKQTEGGSPRLSYSKSFHSSSRETSPSPRQAAVVREQLGSRVSPDKGGVKSYKPSWVDKNKDDSSASEAASKSSVNQDSADVEREASKEDASSNTSTKAEKTNETKASTYTPSWMKKDGRTSSASSKTEEKNSPATPEGKKAEKEPSSSAAKTADKSVSSTPSWKRPETDKSKETPKVDNKSGSYVPSWKRNILEKSSPEKSVEIVDSNKKESSVPAWKSSLRERKLAKETSEEKPILIEEKSPVKTPSKIVRDNKETDVSEKKAASPAVQATSGDRTKMARNSRVMDLMKNFQAQQLNA